MTGGGARTEPSASPRFPWQVGELRWLCERVFGNLLGSASARGRGPAAEQPATARLCRSGGAPQRSLSIGAPRSRRRPLRWTERTAFDPQERRLGPRFLLLWRHSRRRSEARAAMLHNKAASAQILRLAVLPPLREAPGNGERRLPTSLERIDEQPLGFHPFAGGATAGVR